MRKSGRDEEGVEEDAGGGWKGEGVGRRGAGS